jgi:hypothetical protein
MRIQTIGANGTREVAAGLERAILAMPADKQTWRPLDEGRSALDQVAECAVINQWATSLFVDRVMPELDNEAYANACAALDTVDKAVAALRDSTAALASAIDSVPDDALGIQVQFPWDDRPCSLAEAMLMAYWNLTYHIGQVNYVQTLYGDKEMH